MTTRKTKENKIIFHSRNEDYQRYLKENPQLFLRLNSDFKDMGFVDVEYDGKDVAHSENGLKMIIYPYYCLNNYSNGEESLSNSRNNTLRNFLSSKKGYYTTFSFYPIRNFKEDGEDQKEDIFIELENSLKIKEKIVIGSYFPIRNLVFFYIPILNFNLSLGLENECIFYFIDVLKKWVKENKVKYIDNTQYLKKKLIESFVMSSKRRIREVDSTIESCIVRIKENENSMVAYYKTMMQCQKEIIALRSICSNSENQLFKNIDEISKLKFVDKIDIKSNGISVSFKDVFNIKMPKKEYPIGEFTILIKPEAILIENKKPIRIDNTTYHHPHIREDSICFGEGKTQAYQLLGQMRYKELILFCYLFLKSYNPKDKYMPIERIIAKKENKKIEDVIKEYGNTDELNRVPIVVDDDDNNGDDNDMEDE